MGAVWSTPNAIVTLHNAAAMQGLASGSALTSAEINNSSTMDIMADLEYRVSWTVATNLFKAFRVFLLPAVDGTNYPSIGSNNYPQRALTCALLESQNPTNSSTATEYIISPVFVIPPGKFKIHSLNATNTSIHATNPNMSIKLRPMQFSV